MRFTFAQRLDNLMLDALELVVEARYAARARRLEALQRADRKLARFRIVLRLADRRKLVSHGGYEQLSRKLDEAGRMLGGWLRQLEGGT